jgi:hypothetical protein
MTATATEKSSAALRKELDRRSASRTTLLSEIDQAKEKLSIAMDTGDTAACVRLQGRLQALEGLRDQETHLVDQLAEQLAEAETRDARRTALARLSRLAKEAKSRVRTAERLAEELNELLLARVQSILEAYWDVRRLRTDFIATTHRELGLNMVGERADAMIHELEEAGADLNIILAHWTGTALTINERHYEQPVTTPFGQIIDEAIATLERVRTHEARVTAERERSGQAPAA